MRLHAATPATVAAYIAELADPPDDRPPRRVSTISRRLAALSEAHKLAGTAPNPVLDPLARETLAGIRRMLGVAPNRKRWVSTAGLLKDLPFLGVQLRSPLLGRCGLAVAPLVDHDLRTSRARQATACGTR